MSANFKHVHKSTMNAYTSSNTNPLSSSIPSTPQMRRRDEEEEISSCTTFENISQQEDIVRMDNVRGAAIDTITMGHAVRIPHALRSATRRTMLDVLTQLNREKTGNEMDKYIGDALVEERKIPYGGVNTDENPYIDNRTTTTTNTITTNTNNIPVSSTSSAAALPDLTRSLRHLLPSRRGGNAVNARQKCKQQQEEQLHAEEDSISEFEDDDDDYYSNNNDNDNNNNYNNHHHMKKKIKGGGSGGGETRRVQQHYLINEECEVNNRIEQHSFPLTVVNHEEGQRRASHRSWAKLFNCDDNDIHNDDLPVQDRIHTIQQEKQQEKDKQQEQKQEEITKCTPVPRVSTKSSRRSSSSLHAVWADVEEERRSSTAGRHSLATLLDAAEAEDDERRRSLSYMFGMEKTEERVRQLREAGKEEREREEKVEDEESNHSMLLMSSHTFGKPSFVGMMGLSTNGSSSSASAVAALLQGVTSSSSSSISISTSTTTTSGVIKRGSGRGRMSAALKQLSGNPTSARVVTYLARSFDDWKLDAPSISLLNKETEEKRGHSTFEDSSKYALLSETSGVQLKLRVVMVESTYSIYCVRVEIVWADEQTSMELGFSSPIPIPSTTTTTTTEEQNGENSLHLCTRERNTLWTIALTTPSFQSTPVVVGEYLYLARPFFCYPAIHTIVASLNITSDAALRQPNPAARQGHRSSRRRPREEISSQQEQREEEEEEEKQEKEQKQQKQEDQQEEEENDGQNRIMTSYEKMSMDTTTPERPSKPPVSLSAPSPFAAYDPFLNAPTNLFQNNSTDRNSSVIFSQRGENVGISLKMTSEENNNNHNHNNHKNTNTSDTSISVNRLQGVKHDIIGDHFPRGPGDEWDVPLEVLLALCPIQNHAASASSAANVHNLSPSAIRPWMRNGGEEVSSSISSLSSFDEDDGVPPTLTNQKVSSCKYDDVLLSD